VPESKHDNINEFLCGIIDNTNNDEESEVNKKNKGVNIGLDEIILKLK